MLVVFKNIISLCTQSKVQNLLKSTFKKKLRLVIRWEVNCVAKACLLSDWRVRKTPWWGIMSFQISAPSKKASARWENTFGLWLHSSVSWSIFLSVHQPKEEMVFSGKYKTGEQILRLANERFAVPEMLFHPSDIGIQEMGIPEAIVDSIQSLPEGLTFFPTSPLCCRIAYALGPEKSWNFVFFYKKICF